jgi:hypothetical protein
VVEIQCPFCDEAVRLALADLQAGRVAFRCDACRVTADLDDGAEAVVPLAA